MILPLIELENVSVRFPLSFEKIQTFHARAGSLLKRIGTGQFRRKVQEFKALHEVSFSANRGDVVGVIGANGSGKTTLLRAIAGIYQPDSGTVTTRGSLSTLLSLGTGFNNALSGRRNIYMVGHLMGLQRGLIEKSIDEIIDYAEIDEFADIPVKYYSNGMISRLGFAIATTIEPEILLVDEIFSVGDLAFKAKSEKTIRTLLDRAHCQIVVTHSLNFVRDSCNRAVYIRDGEIACEGEPNMVVDEYEHYVATMPRTRGTARVYDPSH